MIGCLPPAKHCAATPGFPSRRSTATCWSRGITDGPDEDFEKLRWTLLGALSIARRSVEIVTPYFLPDSAIVSSLNLAAMRGVKWKFFCRQVK